MNSRDKPEPNAQKRKPYRRPRLEKYGSIRELTQITGGTKGTNDTAAMGNKTGL